MKFKITRSELFLLIISTLITVIVTLGLIRLFAPALLGLPADLILVQSDEKVTPYYENIFNKIHWESGEFILKDPIVRVRATPFYPDIGGMGPNDLLGFRNLSVPGHADVIVIGDSQTYGNNAVIWENWPNYLQEFLPVGSNVYTMATGGWGALQYYYAYLKTPVFEPQVVIIAIYTGNDPLETFSLAVASDLWNELLPQEDISQYTPPAAAFPAPQSEQWHVKFKDGVETIFTSRLRHTSNMKNPAVDAGYQIIKNVASAINKQSSEKGTKIIFTIIPSKEYVYSDKIKMENIVIPEEYKMLIEDEAWRIKDLSFFLQQLPHVSYVDIADHLKVTALSSIQLYPDNENGHPVPDGYRVIAKRLLPVVSESLSMAGNGLVIKLTENDEQLPIYIKNGAYWIVSGRYDEILGYVKKHKPQIITTNDLYGLSYRGHIDFKQIK